MIARMLARGMPVKLRVGVQAHFVTSDPNSYNVIGEISRQPILRLRVRGGDDRGASGFVAHGHRRRRQR